MYKVSIIIPVYNVEKYLRQCLDSVVNQTLKDIEIILVDDGSTDESPKICDEYDLKDNRIKVIHKQNEGLGKAYNTGLDIAQGEYIGFVESDDFAELTMFEDLYNFAKHYDADIVKSDWYDYFSAPDERNEKSNNFKNYPLNKLLNIKTAPQILTIQASVWSALYRRKFLNTNGLRFLNTEGASYQDTSFAFKTTCLAEKFVLVPKRYIHYRKDNEYSSSNSQDKALAICKEYKEIDKFLDTYPEIKVIASPYKWLNQYNGYLWTLRRISHNLYTAFVENFSETFKKAYSKNLLGKEFFAGIKRKKFDLLLNDKQKFVEKLNKNYKKKIQKAKRKKFIMTILRKFSCYLVNTKQEKSKMETIFVWIMNHATQQYTLLGALSTEQELEIDKIINKINDNGGHVSRQSFDQNYSLNTQLNSLGDVTKDYQFVPANELIKGMQFINL